MLFQRCFLACGIILAAIIQDRAVHVNSWSTAAERNNTCVGRKQMEVGIEDCLHIEFEYDKNKYHLKDTVVGKIYFLLVKSLP